MQKTINIQNKKARFNYEILDKYTAGIVLTGTEIKSIRTSKASIAESFCEFNDANELLAIAKLSQPILKTNSREALIKVKLDF